MNQHARTADAVETRAAGWLSVGILLGMIGLALLLKLRLDHAIDVHWDEFNFLSQVYEHERGELRRALMTFHVHVFAWLRQVSGNEVDQVIAAQTIGQTIALAE